MHKRHYNRLDKLLMQAQHLVTTLASPPSPSRANPAAGLAEPDLTAHERQSSIEKMRVNHCGEVCAQALYYGQLVFARQATTAAVLQQAALEETDHLAWTLQRLNELNGRPSYLNVLWYSQSFLLGMIAAAYSDELSLGFVEETEAQVAQHLTNHLHQLPAADHKSRLIVQQMRLDEQQHGRSAHQAGAKPLPKLLCQIMRWQAQVMILVSRFV